MSWMLLISIKALRIAWFRQLLRHQSHPRSQVGPQSPALLPPRRLRFRQHPRLRHSQPRAGREPLPLRVRRALASWIWHDWPSCLPKLQRLLVNKVLPLRRLLPRPPPRVRLLRLPVCLLHLRCQRLQNRQQRRLPQLLPQHQQPQPRLRLQQLPNRQQHRASPQARAPRTLRSPPRRPAVPVAASPSRCPHLVNRLPKAP